MSGTMQPQTIPPQALQRAQQAQPPGMPQGPQSLAPPPQGAPQQGAPQQQPIVPPVVGGMAAQNPNLALFAQAAQGQQPQGQSRLTAAEMSQLGRFGDHIVAHLAPGEIAVPPELQSPQVMAVLNHAFKSVGVSPQQFTAGSGANTHNPSTGAPEFSLLGALLPVIGAVVGSVIPGIGTAAGMALGGAAGGLAGGAIDHTGPMGMLLGAAGGAAGGYLGGSGGIGSLLGSGGGAAGAAGAAGASGAGLGAAANAAPFGAMAADLPSAGAGAATGVGAGPLGSAAVPAAAQMTMMQKIMGGLTAGTGASLASSFAPQKSSAADGLPPGFNEPQHPLNTHFGQILGSQQSNRPFFGGYDPYRAVMGPNPGYRFYPVPQ